MAINFGKMLGDAVKGVTDTVVDKPQMYSRTVMHTKRRLTNGTYV